MNNSNISSDGYIVVLPWMMSMLGLAGNDLLVYALIHGYSQGGVGGYFGSRAHLAETLNFSRRTATDVLARLEERGLITKHSVVIDGVLRCFFRAVKPTLQQQQPREPQPQPEQEQRNTEKPRRFTPPTIDEVQQYCRERGSGVDAQRFYDYYSANGWVQGRGKPIKDWRAAVRTWEAKDKEITNSSSKRVYEKDRIIESRRRELSAEVDRINEQYRERVARGSGTAPIYGGVQSRGGRESDDAGADLWRNGSAR